MKQARSLSLSQLGGLGQRLERKVKDSASDSSHIARKTEESDTEGNQLIR